MSDTTPSVAIPTAHQGLIASVMATLRDVPESAVALAEWIAVHADGAPPAPGEFPKMVHGRTCANRAEEKRSLSLGPAELAPPPPPSDYEKAVKAFELEGAIRTITKEPQ